MNCGSFDGHLRRARRHTGVVPHLCAVIDASLLLVRRNVRNFQGNLVLHLMLTVQFLVGIVLVHSLSLTIGFIRTVLNPMREHKKKTPAMSASVSILSWQRRGRWFEIVASWVIFTSSLLFYFGKSEERTACSLFSRWWRAFFFCSPTAGTTAQMLHKRATICFTREQRYFL